MSRGEYAAAATLAERGRAIEEFASRAAAFRSEWRALWTTKDAGEDEADRTPLWGFYQPILSALDACGGEASTQQIEEKLEASSESSLKGGDLKLTGRKRIPRWKIMIRRARRTMVKEKYLEDHSGKRWRITPLGRQAAQGTVKVATT
jgi:hypothetical protein